MPIACSEIDTVSPRTKINTIIPAAAAQNTAPRVKRNHRVVPRSAHNRAHTRNSDAARRTGSIDNIDLLELRTRSINNHAALANDDCIRLFRRANIVVIRLILIYIAAILSAEHIVRGHIFTVLNMNFFQCSPFQRDLTVSMTKGYIISTNLLLFPIKIIKKI